MQHLTAVQTNEVGFNEEIVRETLKVTQNEQLGAPRNQEEFQKFVVTKCSDSMQRYTYMRLISEEHYATLFSREFDSDLFLVVCRTF